MSYECDSCVGACCTRMMKLPLTNTEAEFLKTSGTLLNTFLPAEDGVSWSDRLRAKRSSDAIIQHCIEIAPGLKEGQGYYQLATDCGNLVQDVDWPKCAVFDSSDRPEVCSEFTAGAYSAGCQLVRLSRGVTFFSATVTDALTQQ